MKKQAIILSLVAVLVLAIMSIAWAEKQTLSPEVKAAVDQLSRKVTSDGKKTRQAFTAQRKETDKAITDAGKATGAAIDRQTKTVKNGLQDGVEATKALADKQISLMKFSVLAIAGVVVLVGGLLAVLIFWKSPAKEAGKSVESISVEFEIEGRRYKYTPKIVGGQYQSPFQNRVGNNLLFSEPADLRRSAMAAFRGNQWLIDQEIVAGLLKEA